MGELSVRELPLFPLPEVVLFPQEVLPLHIFESRYRIMLQSVLESDSMFGVIKWDPNTKSMANVGCCAQIIKHQTSEDGSNVEMVMPGDRIKMTGELICPVAIEQGMRFAIREGGRTIGAGVVSKILK